MFKRLLIVHNYYQQRGGEDAVVEAEVALLREHGHEVELYVRHNDELAGRSKLSLARETFWSSQSASDMREIALRFRPQLVHAHNTFPLVSPSVYVSAARVGIPVVQTIHNFRLLCPQGMLLRDGKTCEDCVGRVPWRGVLRRCYRNSLPQSAVLAGMLSAHRLAGTYSRKVAKYIALNEFCRLKLIEGGLPESRIRVKPNFVDLPRPGRHARNGGLFVGRLSQEKGIATLLEAEAIVGGRRLSVCGTGPLQSLVEASPHAIPLGWADAAKVIDAMSHAAFLVMPSIWYENFPRTLVEAFACSTPVIASRLGALAELVEDGHTGLLFEAGSATDLARKISWANENPERMREMGDNARLVYEARYSPTRNYEILTDIYVDALEQFQRTVTA